MPNPNARKNGGEGTFVGKALRGLLDVSPELVDAIGSFVPGVGAFSKLAHKIRGDETTSDDSKVLLLAEIEKDIAIEQELTRRLESDNEHPITRLIRPVTYGLMFFLFLACVFFDGNVGDFTIKAIYIPTIETLFGTMTVFYFGSRGIEKLMKTYKK